MKMKTAKKQRKLLQSNFCAGEDGGVKFIVGLGNPGREYEMTRHNIGFLVLDELAVRNGLRFRRSLWFPALIAKGVIGSETVRLIKPQTFMNRSGAAVAPVVRWARGRADDVMTVYDDVALAWGRLRLRARGSAGGHNGVQSIMDTLGGNSFSRIRVGIGLKPDKVSLSDFVLGPFSVEERDELDRVVDHAVNAIEMVCSSGIERAMNEFNRG
jgi:PTH1 family peptidyl-tRNA hydrolase